MALGAEKICKRQQESDNDKRHSITGQLKTINDNDDWQGYTTQKYIGNSWQFKKTVICYQTKLQESCAIAKMTAQCALYMGALKIFGTP